MSRCPDVINAQEGFFDVESVWPKLEQALRQAISNLVAMRVRPREVIFMVISLNVPI